MNDWRVIVVVSILGAFLALTNCNNSGGETQTAEAEGEALTREPSPDHAPGRLVATQEEVEAAPDELEAALEEAELGTTCQRVYAGKVAVHNVIGGEIPAPAPEAEFMASCNRLPEKVQRCMLPEHGLANQEACSRAIEGLSPAQTADLQRLDPAPDDDQAPQEH